MRSSARRTALLLAALVAFLAAPASAEYRELDAPYLRLVYPSPTLDYLAPYTARCFENALAFHRRLFDYTPSEKVNVILDDFSDYGNAGVWVNPRNSMSIHIAPSNFVYETGPSNERMNFTMNHEVVHVVALDETAGSDRAFRALFHGKVRETAEHPESIVYGWLTLPRRAAPRWYHEGIAVFLETWMAGGLGRAQGPYDEMVFRSMVRDSTPFWDPLGLESEGTKVDFQVGVNAYLYGTRFMTWLADTRSPADLIRWVGRTPGSRRSFTAQFHKVYGESLDDAWRQWIAFEHDFQRANLDSIRRYPTTPSRDLTTNALGSVSRAFVDPVSRKVWAGVYYPGSIAHIAEIPLDGGRERPVCEVKGPALYFVCSLARDPESGTLYYTSDNNEWRDLCAVDPATGRSRRLVRDARIGDLAWRSTDRTLWGVRHFNGFSTLVRLDAPYTNWHQIMTLAYGRDLYDIDVSPDGRTLSGSVAEIDGRQSLRSFDLTALERGDTTSRVLYDFGSAIPQGFVFSPDGRYLYGTSYYTGVSNVFRYDLAADSMAIVTNAVTGFFRPVPLGGDSLVVFRYGGRGFVPALIHVHPLEDVSAITFLGERTIAAHPELQGWKVPPPSRVPIDSLITYQGPYRGWSALGLATVYPVVESYKEHTAVGLHFDVSDPVQMNRFDFTAAVTPDEGLARDERVHLEGRYRRYDLTAAVRWNPASFYDLVGPRKSSRKGVGASLGWKRQLVRDPPRTLDLSVGLDGWTGLERLPDEQNVSTSPGFDKLLSGRFDLDYKNRRASIGAADYERGWQAGLSGSLDGVRFVRAGVARWRGFPQVVATADGGTPLPLPNSSLWLRTAGGWSPGDPNEPFANFFFGGFGNNVLDHQDPRRYRDWSSLPGAGIDAVAGTDFARAMLDWNLPPLRFRRVGTLAFYATWLRFSLFGGGIATDLAHPEGRRKLMHAGAQTDLRFQLLAQQRLTLSFGWGRAFERHETPGEEWMVSLKIL